MSVMSPELDFAAPELVNGVKCDTYADIFSIGMLAYAVFNEYKPLFESKGHTDGYEKNVAKVGGCSQTTPLSNAWFS